MHHRIWISAKLSKLAAKPCQTIHNMQSPFQVHAVRVSYFRLFAYFIQIRAIGPARICLHYIRTYFLLQWINKKLRKYNRSELKRGDVIYREIAHALPNESPCASWPLLILYTGFMLVWGFRIGTHYMGVFISYAVGFVPNAKLNLWCSVRV